MSTSTAPLDEAERPTVERLPTWSGALCGVLAAACGLAAAELLVGVWTSLRSPVVSVGDRVIAVADPVGLDKDARAAVVAAFGREAKTALDAAGYPDKADPAQVNKTKVILILCVFGLLATMVYGPLAALLVELFPARIRYSSLSLPYHIGNGWIGGFMPTIGFAMVAATGNIYQGLWYAVIIAAVTAVVGILFLPETYKRDIEA